MAKLYNFDVVTPSRVFYNDEVELIVFETEEGQVGVMANHTPMLIANKMGTLKIKKGKEEKYAFISEGFIEIRSNKVTLMVDIAEWIDEIDVQSVISDKKMAEEKLSSADDKQDKSLQLELKASIERANARIKTVGMINNK